MPFKGLDHVAILVPETEAALRLFRDRLGLPVLFSEVVNNGAIRLTHLDLGNVHLQLVEPLQESHPLAAQLRQNGPGLHHLCFAVENVAEAVAELAEAGFAAAPLHQGTQGKRAVFLHPQTSDGIRLELTGA
jgi:methylmalonyl-CoA/ethylmalonyl-CoA epimerase